MEPNPYESPQVDDTPPPARSSTDWMNSRRRLELFVFIAPIPIGILVLALRTPYGNSVMLWGAVPLTLLLVLAVFRTLRLRSDVSVENAQPSDSGNRSWLKTFLFSLLAVVPICIASSIAFCCVCTPTGFAAFLAVDGAPGVGDGFEILAIMIGIFVGMFAALEIGFRLLRRWNYLRDFQFERTPVE